MSNENDDLRRIRALSAMLHQHNFRYYILDDPQIYPPKEVLERLYTVKVYNPRDQRLLTRSWTTVKSGI